MAAEETSPLLNSESQPSYSSRNGISVPDSENQVVAESAPKSYWVFVVPMAIGIFLAAMDQTLVMSSYATIGSELNALQSTSWIATSYLLTITSFQPLYGKLSDIFGRKTCLLFAYTVFAIGSTLCGLSRTMPELVASRAIAGIGGGGMQTVVSIIMSDVVPLRSRGTWQGVLNIVWASGNATGASIGGILADTIGWRWGFLLQVPLTVIAILSVYFTLHLPAIEPGDFKEKLQRVDFGGAITLVFAVFTLLFGLDRGGNASWSDRSTIASLSASAILFLIFGFVEMEFAKEPFAPKRIIVNRGLIASYLVNFFGIAAAFTMIFHAPLYLQVVKGQTASEAGLWLILCVVGALTGSLTGGLTIQATGKLYVLTVLSYFLTLFGSLTVVAFSGLFIISVAGLASGLLIMNFGNGSGVTTSLVSLIANAGHADQALATAVSYLFRSLGSVVGLSVGSTIFHTALKTSLHNKLSGEDVDEIVRKVTESLKYLEELDPATRSIVRDSYGEGIITSYWFSVGLAGFAFISSLFIKEKALS